MFNSPFISIIVPIYNLEIYLVECIKSVMNQSYTNFELLLIDDGSTDSSGQLCDYFVSVDKRIKVFHKENGGVSTARNLGIKNSIGEYICFVDGDDILEPTYLNAFICNIIDGKGMYLQGYIMGNRQLTHPYCKWNKSNLISGIFDLEKCILLGLVWNKMYLADIIKDNNLIFDEQITIGEDIIFVMSYISYCDFIINIPETNYIYRQYEGSACTKEHSFDSWNKRLDRLENIFMGLESLNPCLVNQLRANDFYLSFHVLRIAYHDRISREKRLSFLEKMRDRGKLNKIVKLADLSLENKILLFPLFYFDRKLCDYLYCCIRNFRSLFR